MTPRGLAARRTSAITPGHHRSPALHPCRGGHWPSARRGIGPALTRANSHNLTRYGFASACFFTWLLPRTSDAEQSGGLFCILFPGCGGSAAGTGIHSHRPYTRIRIRPVSLHTDSHPARLCPMRRQPRFMAEGRFIWPKAMLHRPRAQQCGRFIFATFAAFGISGTRPSVVADDHIGHNPPVTTAPRPCTRVGAAIGRPRGVGSVPHHPGRIRARCRCTIP